MDGAIHRAGGPAIMRELDTIRAKIGRCATGSAVVTAAAVSTTASAAIARFGMRSAGTRADAEDECRQSQSSAA